MTWSSAGTLSGAYQALEDALQRGREQWGQTIADATKLTSVIAGLAAIVERLNSIDPGPIFNALRLLAGFGGGPQQRAPP